jgi:hypothetical protein
MLLLSDVSLKNIGLEMPSGEALPFPSLTFLSCLSSVPEMLRHADQRNAFRKSETPHRPPQTLKGPPMRHPHTHLSRAASLNRTALRKGYDLSYDAKDGTWSLKIASTGDPTPAGSTLDDIAVYLQTKQLIG